MGTKKNKPEEVVAKLRAGGLDTYERERPIVERMLRAAPQVVPPEPTSDPEPVVRRPGKKNKPEEVVAKLRAGGRAGLAGVERGRRDPGYRRDRGLTTRHVRARATDRGADAAGGPAGRAA
jgi:hypothetical protein